MHIIKLVIYLNIILSAFFLWIELLKYLIYFLVVRFNYEDWLQRVVNITETTGVYVTKHKLCILNIKNTHTYMYIYTCHAMLSNFSHVQLFATPWTVASQAPLGKNIGVGCISFSRGSCWPRDQMHVSCLGRRVLYHWAIREACVCVCVFQILWNFSSWKMRQHGHCL